MVFYERRVAIYSNETTYDDRILPSKIFQRHLETKTTSVWDLVQNDQSPFQWNLVCLYWLFHGERSSYINRTSVHLTNNRESNGYKIIDLTYLKATFSLCEVLNFLLALQVIARRVRAILTMTVSWKQINMLQHSGKFSISNM